MASLNEVLKGEPAAKTAVVNEAIPASPDRTRYEQGKFAKGDKAQVTEAPKAPEPAPAASPAAQPQMTKPEPSESEQGLKAALMAERKKRQEAERKWAEANAKPEQRPDVLTDPQGYAKSVDQTLQTRLVDERVNMSAFLAKQAHKDYDAVMEHWETLVSESPYLYQQAVTQEVPCEWAYQYVKKQLFLKDVGDPESYKTKLETELRAKWDAEQSAKPQAPTPPPSLASAAGSGRVSDPAWTGPRPLSAILKRK